jgi:hypothetical protein
VAIAANETHTLTPVDIDAYIVKKGLYAVGFGEIFYFKHREGKVMGYGF